MARCTGAELRVKAGREGESQGAHGDIYLTNVGSRPCALRGLPTVAIVTSGGTSLRVRPAPSANSGLQTAIVLPPGRPDAADLVVFWANWCGHRPGPLAVRLTLPAGGVVAGPFDGPPDSNVVPGCVQPGQPSTLAVLGYQPGSAAPRL